MNGNGSVGTRLKEARSARGLGLDEAFENTRIHKRFLEALERDAPPREFPAPVYARAFLEEYARYLGLDPDPLVDDYRRTHGEPPPEPLRLPTPVDQPRGPWGKVLLTVASTAALVAITIFAVRAGREAETVAPSADPVPSPVVTPTESPEPTTSPESAIRGIRLRVNVVDAPSWMQVVRGDDVLISDTVEPGFSRTFRAPPRTDVDVLLGNAGAVRLVLNEERLGVAGEAGQIYEATFVYRGGRARVIEAE